MSGILLEVSKDGTSLSASDGTVLNQSFFESHGGSQVQHVIPKAVFGTGIANASLNDEFVAGLVATSQNLGHTDVLTT